MSLTLVPIFASAWVPDDKARALAQDIAAAIDGTRYRNEDGVLIQLTRKVAAARLGISEQLLSEWLACVRPINLFRFTALPSAFWDSLLRELAARQGGMFLSADLVMLMRGAAMVPRAMQKMAAKVAERRTA